MLDYKQIEAFYPEHLKPFKRNIMREYLQHRILSIIYSSEFGRELAFMGGTALRVAYNHERFSEDLDFDNLGLNSRKFKEMTELIEKKLRYEGYIVETRNTFKNAYRCYLKINRILHESGLSGHKEEKLLVQIDAEPQNFKYAPNLVILNKFDLFLRIQVVPIGILLSQKLYAILHRKRTMGRDFFDAVFLFGRTMPNFDYLKEKTNITNKVHLKKKLLDKCKNLDFKRLAKDIEPFLVNPDSAKNVLYFCDYIKDILP